MDVTLLDRQVNLLEEGIDLAIRIGPLEDSTLIARELASLLWVTATAPAYLDRHGEPRTVEDLADHDRLIYTAPAALEWGMIFRGGKTADLRMPAKMRSNTLDGAVAAAVEGVGLVRAPAWQVSEHVASGCLKVILREHEAPPLPIHAVLTHNKLLSSTVRVLLDFLIAEWANADFDVVPEFGCKAE
jgi:DNA-binding transcriptional LysR family regulator